MGQSATTIGLDVGGTKIAVARLEGAELASRELVTTERSGTEQLLEQIASLVEQHRTPAVAAVGLGVPSVVEFSTGRARSSVNVPLQDVPLRSVLRERLELPVYVDNDATVAALAEAHDGEHFAVPDLVAFTVGTGIGAGLVLGGRVYRGATGAAGEAGHQIIGLDLSAGAPPAGAFPQQGSLEALASGGALGELARAASRGGGALARRAAEGRAVTGVDAVEAARAGDADALGALRVLGERLGVGIANAINVLDPLEVVIGGGVAAGAGELLLAPARETAARFVLPGVGQSTEIRLARHGAEAGVRGAALLARLELDSSPESRPPVPEETGT